MDESKEIEYRHNGLAILPFLARLVEAYECSPNRAEYVLRFRHLLGSRIQTQKKVNPRVAKALDSSGKSALEDAYNKTLHLPSKYLDEYQRLLDHWYLSNASRLEDELTEDEITSWEDDYELTDEERERRGHLFDNPHFQVWLNEESERLRENPDLRQALARELGVAQDTDAFDLVIRRHQNITNDSEARHFARISRPKPGILWSKELIGRIEEIVGREREWLRHPVAFLGEQIPKSIHVLFEQSHLCFLFDLEVPCIISCGALLEEAIETKFPDLSKEWIRRWSKDRVSTPFPKKVEEVIAAYPSVALISDPVLRVYKVRNEVVHEPANFLKSHKCEPIEILRDTRGVLRILYENAGPKVRGN